jgi:hypothetical protein
MITRNGGKNKRFSEWLFNSHEESFKILPRLLLALQESNPGTIVQCDHMGYFNNVTTIYGRVF